MDGVAGFPGRCPGLELRRAVGAARRGIIDVPPSRGRGEETRGGGVVDAFEMAHSPFLRGSKWFQTNCSALPPHQSPLVAWSVEGWGMGWVALSGLGGMGLPGSQGVALGWN